MYISTYVYYMILLYLEGSGSKFHSVNTKTNQFPLFFGFQELRKNMSTSKLINFPHFKIPGVEKKHVYIYNMYIYTYVYYMILLYLEDSGSKFHSVNTKTSQFFSFFGFQELRKKHVNTKTSKLPFFGFQELRKNMYIYIYIGICQLFPTISPYIMGSSIANGISFSS